MRQFLFILCACVMFSQALQSAVMTESEAEAIAIDAYIYGYPLVTMDLTKQVMTNVEAPQGLKAPVGQFVNARTYPNASLSFKAEGAPNADTLYSTAWVDLSKEPYILQVPNENGRYYLMPILSAWTNVIAAPGTRTTGTEAASFAITGPNWRGTVPQGVKEIKSPTNLIWIRGRTYSTGTEEDYKEVHKIQDQYQLTPLSYFGRPYSPPIGKVNPELDMKTPVRDQVNHFNIETFFNRLAMLMKENPPAREDSAIIAKMEKIGLVPGKEFVLNQFDPKRVQTFQRVPSLAIKMIMSHQKHSGKEVNGWMYSPNTGKYGTDYVHRAFITAVGLGANLPEDAIYPMSYADSEGNPLDGANRYQLHFNRGQQPPVKGFWSLTMYNSQFFFFANPLNRYSLSPRNPLKYNPDGSLDLYIQNENPGKDKESNWLPAPKGHFNLMLRFYWPEKALINGSWKPPAIKKI